MFPLNSRSKREQGRTQKEQREFLALCTAAKEGEKAAAEELEVKLKLHVWTTKELKALNYFLNHKKSFQTYLEEGKRSYLSQEEDLGGLEYTILWTTPLDLPYFLACVLNSCAYPQYWMAYSSQGQLKLAFDTQSWLTYCI